LFVLEGKLPLGFSDEVVREGSTLHDMVGLCGLPGHSQFDVALELATSVAHSALQLATPIASVAPLPPRSIAIVATDPLHVHVAPMVVAMVMVAMVVVAMVMVMVVLMIHWPQNVARPITAATDHPASPQTLPAPVDTCSRTPMADLDGGSVGDLKLLMAVLKELGWLGSNVPGPRGRTILWAINQLASIGFICPGSLPPLSERLQLIVEGAGGGDVGKHKLLCSSLAIATV